MGVERDRLRDPGRLEEGLDTASPWYLWCPYLSERAWGTDCEDYSADGNAWSFFPHDHARSRAYRWNEEGMAGLSDVFGRLCLGLALWNGRDPILKERMFGLTGLRALSRRHRDAPFRVDIDGYEASIDYEPGESTTGLFGGNSNWRGPIWFPVNDLFIESLLRWDEALGETFTVEHPSGSGRRLRFRDVAADLAARLVSIWLPDADGRRPVAGSAARLRDDPEWRDLLFFHEYFHGDTGAGIGASHQTGWTGLVAHLLCRGGPLDRGSATAPGRETVGAGR